MIKIESNAPVEDLRILGNPESERNPSEQSGSPDEDVVGQADDEDDFDDDEADEEDEEDEDDEEEEAE